MRTYINRFTCYACDISYCSECAATSGDEEKEKKRKNKSSPASANAAEEGRTLLPPSYQEAIKQ